MQDFWADQGKPVVFFRWGKRESAAGFVFAASGLWSLL